MTIKNNSPRQKWLCDRLFYYLITVASAAVILLVTVPGTHYIYAQEPCEMPCCCGYASYCTAPPPEADCGEDGQDCEDKWGNITACPPDGDGGDGGGGDPDPTDPPDPDPPDPPDPPEECFDKWDNPVACDSDGCVTGGCCDAAGANYSAAVAQAAGCEPPDPPPTCDGIEYDPDTEGCCDDKVKYNLATEACCEDEKYLKETQRCCPEGIIPKEEPCSCSSVEKIREGGFRVTQYYTPIESDFPSGSDVLVKLDSTGNHYQNTIDHGAPSQFHISKEFEAAIRRAEGWGQVKKNGVTFYIGGPHGAKWWCCDKEAHGCYGNDLIPCQSVATRYVRVVHEADIYIPPSPTTPFCSNRICGKVVDTGNAFQLGEKAVDVYVGVQSQSIWDPDGDGVGGETWLDGKAAFKDTGDRQCPTD